MATVPSESRQSRTRSFRVPPGLGIQRKPAWSTTLHCRSDRPPTKRGRTGCTGPTCQQDQVGRGRASSEVDFATSQGSRRRGRESVRRRDRPPPRAPLIGHPAARGSPGVSNYVVAIGFEGSEHGHVRLTEPTEHALALSRGLVAGILVDLVHLGEKFSTSPTPSFISPNSKGHGCPWAGSRHETDPSLRRKRLLMRAFILDRPGQRGDVPTGGVTPAMALMKEIFVARKALALILTSSAVA